MKASEYIKMTRNDYRNKDKKYFGEPKLLLLIDKYGNTVRHLEVNCYPKIKRIKEEWKRLYANNKAYQEATYKLVDKY